MNTDLLSTIILVSIGALAGWLFVRADRNQR